MRDLNFVAFSCKYARSKCAFALLRLAISALLLVFLASNAQAQFEAKVQGTVTDGKGATVQGANVALTDEATLVSKSTTTSAEGFYQFNEVAPATYTLTVEAKGF